MAAPGTLYDLPASRLASGIADGSFDPVDVIDESLARIELLEPEIRAWAHLDAEGARREAKSMRRELREGRRRGPMHGVPVGIKDVIHVEGMPTLANSRITDAQARYPDAGVVAALRRAGAVILGKCETVEFAGMGERPQTHNPWKLGHTPGGSSSGSGAAVGARMVPVALGTQTGGSTLRPAGFCGVAGFKPTFGMLPRDGILPFSWSLDHPGIIALAAEDLEFVFEAISGTPPAKYPPERAWRVGLLREYFLELSDADTAAAIERTAERLAAESVTVTELALPPAFKVHRAVQRMIMNTEAATYHASGLAARRERFGEKMRLAVEAFSLVPASYYQQALRIRGMLRAQLLELFERADILIMPTSPAPAPAGLESTGDSSMASPWSLVGFPSASVPCGLSSKGLPIGLQIVGRPEDDGAVLAFARFVEDLLGRLPPPELVERAVGKVAAAHSAIEMGG